MTTICCEERKDERDPVFEPGIEYDTFSDARDDQVYYCIKIGSQVWMAQNLAYKVPAGCRAYKDEKKNVNIYGYLYNWETARNVCPAGWHLPSGDEFYELIDFLGGSSVAGGKMKRTGSAYWGSPNTGATNVSGFTALPGGTRYNYDGGWYDGLGSHAGFWTSSDYSVENTVFYLSLSYNSATSGSSFSINGLDMCDKEDYGHSVRCIKD